MSGFYLIRVQSYDFFFILPHKSGKNNIFRVSTSGYLTNSTSLLHKAICNDATPFHSLIYGTSRYHQRHFTVQKRMLNGTEVPTMYRKAATCVPENTLFGRVIYGVLNRRVRSNLLHVSEKNSFLSDSTFFFTIFVKTKFIVYLCRNF